MQAFGHKMKIEMIATMAYLYFYKSGMKCKLIIKILLFSCASIILISIEINKNPF